MSFMDFSIEWKFCRPVLFAMSTACRWLLLLMLGLTGCSIITPPMNSRLQSYTLDYDSQCDLALQSRLEAIDVGIRTKYNLTTDHTAVGLLDLKSLRLAMIHPDRIE